MQKTNYFSGMEVKPSDLLTDQAYFEKRIDTNMSVIGTKGVIVGAETQDGIILNTPYVWTDTQSLGVYGLMAYDSYGRFIFVEPKYSVDSGTQVSTYVPTVSNLTPDENNKLVPGGTQSFGTNKEYWMVIRWAQEEDTSSESMRPSKGGRNKGQLLPSRINTSFELYIRDVESGVLSGDVILAKITTDDLGIIYADETYRDTFSLTTSLLRADMADTTAAEALGNDLTFEDHINMVGSGKVTKTNPHGTSAEDLGIDISATGKHQYYLHSDGIKTDDVNSTTSALYPSYFSSSLTSEEKVYIEALTDTNNEIVVVNGSTLTTSDLGDRYVLDMLNYVSEEYEGFYILAVSEASKSITLNGPYASDTNASFLALLSDRAYLPICSFHWGRPYYAYYTIVLENLATGVRTTYSNIPSTRKYVDSSTGEEVALTDLVIKNETPTGITGTIIRVTSGSGTLEYYYLISRTIELEDANRYDIDPLTFKDRRVFNNTGFKDIRREDLAAVRDAAPFSNNKGTIYYARVESDVQLSYFQVGGKSLSMVIDGNNFYYTFVGVQELSIEQLLSQLNGELKSQIPSTIKPRAYINHNKHLTIVAGTSISVRASGSANASLGLSVQTDTGEDVKTLIYDGDMPSVQEMYYDANGDLTDVYYLTAGNYIRSHKITYTGDFVSSVDETVEVF